MSLKLPPKHVQNKATMSVVVDGVIEQRLIDYVQLSDDSSRPLVSALRPALMPVLKGSECAIRTIDGVIHVYTAYD